MAGSFPGIGSYGGTPEEEALIRQRIQRRGSQYGLADQMGGMDGVGNPLADSLNFEPEPFYSADTGITRSGYDYIGDLGAALLAGSGYRAGPADFGSNLGQAAQQANASYSQRLRQQVNDRVTNYGLKRQQRQDALEEQERQRQAAAEQQKAEYIASLPPEVQAVARFNPEALGTQLAKQAFPDPEKPIEVNGNLVMRQPDGSYQPVYSAPKAPVQGPETYRPITPEEAAAYRIPDPAGYVIGSVSRLPKRIDGVGGSTDLQLVPIKGPNGETIYAREQDAINKPVGSVAQGAAQYRRMTPEEEKTSGLPPGPNFINLQTGLPEVVDLPSNGVTVGPDGSVQIGGPAGAGVKIPANYEPDPANPGRVRPIGGGPADPTTPTGATVSKQQAAKVAFENLDGTLGRITTLVDQYGTELMPGEVKSELESLYGDALLQYKEVNALGALTGPDLPLMESILGSATSLGANLASMNPFGGNPAKKKLEVFKQLLERSKKNSATLLGGGASPPPPPAVTDTTVKTPSSQAELDSYLDRLGY